jgi:hypothetical protein
MLSRVRSTIARDADVVPHPQMLKSTIAEQIKLLHRHNRLVTTDRAAIQETHRVVFAA